MFQGIPNVSNVVELMTPGFGVTAVPDDFDRECHQMHEFLTHEKVCRNTYGFLALGRDRVRIRWYFEAPQNTYE